MSMLVRELTVAARLLARQPGYSRVDVTAADPVTYVGVALAMGSIAVLACLLPAGRATRANPLDALRAS